ncbi:MAG: dihydroneopterin aldolase [Chitinophagaceae bacterium]|nr:dihydroneopterin aldolase [Oligoflexus sp.]
MHVLSQITGRPLDTITLRDLSVQCVIGVHPEEKILPQPLKLNVRIYLDTAPAGISGILSRTIDYSLVAKQLSFILTYSRFRLLESAAEALAVFLLTPARGDHPPIHAVDIEIKKPEALGGVSEPSVRIFRDLESRQGWYKKGSPIKTLFQVPEAALERWLIPAGESLTVESSEDLALMAESPGLTISGRPASAGLILPFDQKLIITNPSDEENRGHESGSDPKSVLAVTFRGRERRIESTQRLH